MRSVIVYAILTVAAPGATVFAENLVENGSFERDGHWHTASIHHPDRVSYDNSTAAAGGRCLRLDGRGAPIFMLTRAALTQFRPGGRYAIRAAMRATTNTGYVYVAIREHGRAGSKTTFTLGKGGARAIHEWRYLSGEFTVEANTQRVDVFLYNIRSQGVAWLDDVVVREIGGDEHPFVLTCRRTRTKPAIDGALDEWSRSDRAEDVMLVGAGSAFPIGLPHTTAAGMMFDDTNLYIWGSLEEPTGHKCVTTQGGRDSPVYRDDSMEIFLSPRTARSDYHHFCINSAGAIYDSYRAPHEAGSGDITWDSGATVKTATRDRGWSFEMAVPLAALKGFDVRTGSHCAVNFCRNTGKRYWSWAKLEPGQGYHTPSAFQKVQFADDPERRPKSVSWYRLLRGRGLVTNPDFQQRDEHGTPLFWEARDGTLSQSMVTGFISGGTSIDAVLMGPGDGKWGVTLEYATPEGETRQEDVPLTPNGPGLWLGRCALSENASSLTRCVVHAPVGSRPYHVQLAGAAKLTFLAKRKQLYAYHVDGDRSTMAPGAGAVLTIYRELSLIRGMPCPFLFSNMHRFSERLYRQGARLVLDLPDGLELYSPGLFSRACNALGFECSGASPHGAGYRRWTVPYTYFKDTGYSAYADMYFLTDLSPGKHEPAYYHLEWAKGRQPEEKLDVRVYPKPKVRAPRRLLAGTYIHLLDFEDTGRKASIFDDPKAPDILKSMNELGLNAILLCNNWPRASGKQKLPATVRLVEQMRAAGLEPGLHTSGFMYFSKQAKKEGALAVTLDGKTDDTMCPSYRGPTYQALIETWGDAANYGVYWVDNDFEDWNYREHTVCFCDRCKRGFRQWLSRPRPGPRPAMAYMDPQEVEESPGQFAELHRAWWEFKNGLIEQWHRDLRDELKRNMAARGVVKTGFPKIGITESQTCWDWKRLTGTAIDYDSPMLYAYLHQCYPEPSVESCGRRMLEYRLRTGVDRRKYIVTIAPGERTGEVVVPDKAMKYQVLEAFGSGAAGFKIWNNQVMNGGKYYWMSEALRMVAPVEDILLDGEFAVTKCTNPNARVHTFRHKKGTVVFVAEYGLAPVEVPVLVGGPGKVYDLDTGQAVASVVQGAQSIELRLGEDRVRLLFVGKEEQWREIRRGSP